MENKSAKIRQRGKRASAETGKPKRKKLTLKQEAFAEHYIANGGNGVRAAEAAGYAGSYSVLNEAARDNLQKPVIASYVRERLKGVKATSDEVMFLLSDHLRADIADISGCFDENGQLDLKLAKQRGVSHLIKKVKVQPVGRDEAGQAIFRTEVEMHDSQSAAAKLGDYLGLKQMPRVNQEDVARVNAEIVRLVANGWEPEDARQIVIEAEPTAATWLN